MTKAIAARHSAPMSCTATASVRPTISPASIAPGTLPMPPRIAAANSGSSRSSPICGRICTSSPALMPATQARPAPSSQTTRITLRTSMPTTPASCGFSLTARIERPIAVRVSSRWTATTSTAETPSDSSWSGVARMPPPSGSAICSALV